MLIETIDSWSRKGMNHVAHQYRDHIITYGALKEHSDALAAWISQYYREHDILRQTPVIVYGHKENEMLVSFLAAVKSGNPYIPVDTSVPGDRLQQIIRSSQAKLILSPQTVPGEIFNFDLKIIENMELNSPEVYADFLGQTVPPEIFVQSEEVYYIIYTSGSTGIPKGVQIPLKALESFLKWVNSAYAPQEQQEVFLNQAPFSFDLSVMDLYMALSTGGTLWSIDKTQIASHRELFESLANSRVSFWVSTPSFADFCLLDRKFEQSLLPNLKRFLFCGEVLTHDCASKLKSRFPQAVVENLYGPTEATVAATTISITSDILEQFNPLPVGACKPDSRLIICDSDRLSEHIQACCGMLTAAPDMLEDGERGEIVIAGPNVSIGYLNNPEQTKRAFFSWEEEGVFWQAYRTGDAGAWKDGLLFFYGRLDFQVKLHGYRIELGDIEENLRKIEWVENAVVLPVVKREKIEYLQAFVTTKKAIMDEFDAGQEMRQQLKQYLPEYMIPRRLRFLEKMPMTANGKVDRRALAEGN